MRHGYVQHGVTCVCIGLVGAIAFIWLLLQLPKAGPNDVTTTNHRPLIVTPRPGGTR